MSKDPILFKGGDTNLYGYVLADPVNFVDPGLIGMPAIEQPDGPSMGGPPDTGQCEPVYPEIALAPFAPGTKNLKYDGPSGTRLGQLRYGNIPLVRLDFGPTHALGGTPILHLHILPNLFPNLHIPIPPGPGR